MAPVASHEQAPNMLNRVDRLDVILGYLEEIRGGRKSGTRSPATTTNWSGPLTGSDIYTGGTDSSVTSSPKSLSSRRCRSIKEAMMEIQVKGTLFDRIDFLENRLLKLEEEVEMERKESDGWRSPKVSPKVSPGQGFKNLVKSCVKGGHVKTKE
ncbi:hypothetical protein FCM35_KLT11965 [Carex littledalei]|uniref:Uncharacterized protein n=1 Tax=Carex littledalei TaxID=544730 RepID=A0A833VG76_9POAL|nr:hypothetical protein FCM35_KLT11965 [Carex littledalei]